MTKKKIVVDDIIYNNDLGGIIQQRYSFKNVPRNIYESYMVLNKNKHTEGLLFRFSIKLLSIEINFPDKFTAINEFHFNII